jgi:hypothetical protein
MEPPAYVLILAAIFHIFGTGVAAEAVKVGACTAMSALRCALAPWLANRLELGKAVVITAAIFSVFWIGALDSEIQGDWDAPYTAVLVILLAGIQYRRPLIASSARWAASLGLLWGLAMLFSSSVATILVGLLVVEFWHSGRTNPARFAARVACVGACIFLVLLPWGIRNRITMGSWIFTRTGMGYALALSYHPGAHWSDFVNNEPSLVNPAAKSPYPPNNPEELQRVTRMGEIAYENMKFREGLNFILQYPSESLKLFAQHVFYFWFPPGPKFYSWHPGRSIWVYAVAKWGLTVLAFAGLALLWKRNRAVAAYLGSMLVFYPLPYYLINWSSRYRLPIEWTLVLLAAVPVALAWERLRRGKASAAAVAGEV